MADEDPWVDIVNDPITATGATGAGGAPAEASAARPAPSAVAPAAAGMHKGMLIPGPPPGPPPGGPPQPPTPAACDRAAGRDRQARPSRPPVHIHQPCLVSRYFCWLADRSYPHTSATSP